MSGGKFDNQDAIDRWRAPGDYDIDQVLDEWALEDPIREVIEQQRNENQALQAKLDRVARCVPGGGS